MAVQDLERIEKKLDLTTAGAVAVSDSVGGIMFTNMAEVMEFSKLLSLAGTAVPKHLRGNPGGCLAVTIQALEWRMSPIAVANQSYEVGDKIAYMSQLIHGVVEARAPLRQRLRVRYEGEAEKRVCIVTGHFKNEAEPVEYRSPEFGKITPKNSPLWKSDPDQQQFYYSVRAFSRRFCPDVLLGIYSEDELAEAGGTAETAVDITPEKPGIAKRLKGGKGRGFSEAHVTSQTDTATGGGAPVEDIETPRQRGDRLLAECKTAEDVFELSASISEELDSDARPAWLEACDARKAQLGEKAAA